MKIITVNNPQAISNAITILNVGGVIAYPTDTLYGFGVDATNDNAIERINLIKGRKAPISVLAPDVEAAINWMNITVAQLDLVSLYIGGPKTLIVPVKQNIVSNQILGDNNSLGIRIPDNDFCIELSKKFGKPITSTSVNRAGQESLNDPKAIECDFRDEINLLIDAGTLPKSHGSTIYHLKDNKIKILRK